ncbi:hypothetical protein [Corynebacterium lubricantis]|uniref:hypothetical protein n=1 Tax=Corynebacterium lubricantis TaxID=541095 RepID=UPI0003787EF3|nr:hypothetical protein [Corynebacterium lubricantis]
MSDTTANVDADSSQEENGGTNDTEQVTPNDLADKAGAKSEDSEDEFDEEEPGDDSSDEDEGQDDADDSVSDDESDDDDDSGEESDDVKHLRRQMKRKNTENKKLRERARTAERKAMQYEAVVETGLPFEMAKRLQGDTLEEMKADAKSLADSFGPRGFVPGAFPDDGVRRGEVQAGSDNETDLAKIGERIYNR